MPVGSAPDADLGSRIHEAVQLAIEQANAAGEYEGLPFELVVREGVGLWGASSNEMVAFRYEDDVLAVIGSIDGANTHVALRVALKVGLPMVNTATTDPTLTETNIPWLVRCMADDRQQGYALAHHIFNERRIKRVVALRSNDRFGRTGITEFRDAARRLKHPLRLELRWKPGDTDFTAQLDRIAQTDAEALVLWGNAKDTAAIVRQIRARNSPLHIFGCDRLVDRTFLDTAGDAAEGVVAVASCDPTRDDPRLRAFVRQFAARWGHKPDTFAAHAYDGANLLIDAIRKAGLNRTRIRDALYAVTHYAGVTGPIEFDTTLNDVGPVYLATVRDGQFVYRAVDWGTPVHARRVDSPYRTLAQDPPQARSPDRPAVESPAAQRIGCFLPLDATGQAVVRGIRMALSDDNAQHSGEPPFELLVRDARGSWGEESGALVSLVFDQEVLAIIGSTERRGTHLAEMLSAKMHFPVVTLCDTDPTVTRIPLPWVFCMSPGWKIDSDFAERCSRTHQFGADMPTALGYDAAALLAERIRAGGRTRRSLRDHLAADDWHLGVSGAFRFDPFGNRIDRMDPVNVQARGGSKP